MSAKFIIALPLLLLTAKWMCLFTLTREGNEPVFLGAVGLSPGHLLCLSDSG